jgi:hypothetical protein
MRSALACSVLLVACGSSKPAEPAPSTSAVSGSAKPSHAAPAIPSPTKAGSMTTYHLSNTGSDLPVTVEIAIPPAWTADPIATPDAPMWKLAGARLLSLVAISPRGDDDATRVGKAIKMQYDDLTGAERVDLPDGRVWISARDGENQHARLFVPFADGVVMGVAILEVESAGQLPAIRAVFDTIKIVAAPTP